MAGWSISRRLFAIDILAMAFVAALGGAAAARAAQIPGWPAIVAGCAVVAAFVPLLGFLRTHLDIAPVRLLHDWSCALYLYAIYVMVLQVAAPLHDGRVFDAWLAAADLRLFGGDPAVWIARVTHPVLTAVLQTVYASFFLLPLMVAVELYAGGREWRFRQWAFVCGAGFFAAYAGYLVLPAVGPGSAADGLGAADAVRLAPRDAFPSRHALVTLLTVAWAWRYRLRMRWAVTAAGLLVIVSIGYLRNHYAVDVLAGAILAVLTLALGPALHAWLSRQLGTLDADRTA